MNPRNSLIIGLSLTALAGFAPVNPDNAQWVLSCSDSRFNTPSGWLEEGYYLYDNGVYQISISDRPCAVRETYTEEEVAQSPELQARIALLTQATTTGGTIYADVFVDGQQAIAEPVTRDEYKALEKVDARVPTKIVRKSLVETLVEEAEASMTLTSTSTSFGSGTSLTYAHTISGSNPFLVISPFVQAAVNVTSVTYAGDTATYANGPVFSQSAGNERIWSYYDSSPNSGTNNVVITLASSASLQGYSAHWTGVGGFDSQGVSSGCTSGTTCSVTFTVAANSVTWVMYRNAFDAVIKSTNLSVDVFPVGALGAYASGVNAGGSTTYSVTVTTQTSTFPTALSAVSFTPLAAGTTTVNRFMNIEGDVSIEGDATLSP